MPDPSCPKALIVGGGVIGAAAFFELSKKCSVTLLERSRVAQGCTAWSGGIVRCFHDNPLLADRAVNGFQYYTRFEEMTGIAAPFTRTGFLFFPHPSRRDWSRQEVTRLGRDIEIEWLDADVVTHRFGGLLAGAVPGAVYEPNAGYMDAAQVARAWLEAGQQNGGRILQGVEVQTLILRDRRVVGVQSNAGPIFAENVVLATGPQTPSMLDRLGIPHGLYRQDIQVDLRATEDQIFEHPAFIDEEFGLNGRPDASSGGMYIGYATHLRNMPDRSSIDLAHSLLIEETGRRRFAWVAGSRLDGGLRSADCYAADDCGMVRPLSELAACLFVATGFSGGGFKMAPWIANEMTRLLLFEPVSVVKGRTK